MRASHLHYFPALVFFFFLHRRIHRMSVNNHLHVSPVSFPYLFRKRCEMACMGKKKENIGNHEAGLMLDFCGCSSIVLQKHDGQKAEQTPI